MTENHFSVAELCFSRHGPNTPPQDIVAVLEGVTIPGMEVVRSVLGDRPISVNSGWRSEEVNRAVGGVLSSAHRKGFAVDFNCFGFGDPLAVCRKLKAAADAGRLKFDQLIQEGTWVHISFAPTMRGQVLTKTGDGYKQGL